jgi:hypothetical protein
LFSLVVLFHPRLIAMFFEPELGKLEWVRAIDLDAVYTCHL